MVTEAVAEQAKARYYPELNAYAIQTGGTIRPLSAFNIAGAFFLFRVDKAARK